MKDSKVLLVGLYRCPWTSLPVGHELVTSI